jgi:16S rRNA (guanine527-N7)-methyltransferase
MDNFLSEYLGKVGIEADEKQIEQLNTYYEMLVEKNKVMNLTGITEYKEVVIKHFADSAAIIKAMDLKKIGMIIDIGTGAGFPGIVLKILFPHIKITLLDSLNKRINFLNEVIDSLQLKNIETIHGRAEDFAQDKKYREKYDLCVSRAVANLATLSEYCIPFVKVGGSFVSYKAGECDEEVKEARNAISKLGSNIDKAVDYVLPDTDIARTFVVIMKNKNTPKMYPRKAGVPSKDPLK